MLYAADIRTASQAEEAGELFRAKQLLDRHLPAPGEVDRRDFAWYCLASRVDLHEIVCSTAPWRYATWLGVAPDGQSVASGHSSGAIVIWSTSDWQPKVVLSEHKSSAVRIEYRADGTLVSGDSGGKVMIWDLPARRPRRVWQSPEGQIATLACAPAGPTIAIASGREIWMWDGESEQPDRPLQGANGKPAATKTQRMCERYSERLVGSMVHDLRSILTLLKTNCYSLIEEVAGESGAMVRRTGARVRSDLEFLEMAIQDMNAFTQPV